MRRILAAVLLLFSCTAAGATTWFVRADGGTRYSTDLPYGGCNGTGDAAYPGLTSNLWLASIVYTSGDVNNYKIVDGNGNYETLTTAGTSNSSAPSWPAHGTSGTVTTDGSAQWTSGALAPVNQACGFRDVRYMWMTGGYGNSAWVMAGGDTLVIRGCTAMRGQQNPSNPNCRVGWDTSSGGFWCVGVSDCAMIAPPSGTAGAHTKILGACAYGTYTCNPVEGYPYTSNNLTQLFGGFGLGQVLELGGTNYVDVEGIELTEHNGTCTRLGAPQWPSACASFPPNASDYANTGFTTSKTTTNLTLQDIYLHGFTGPGVYGGIGAGINITRVSIDFNAFAGWNFDDGVGDAANATLIQSYMTMVGNGCLEQYPIVNTQFPAKACWDDGTSGFGDSWSGGTTTMSTFTCDRCLIAYNTKDGGIGPHTLVTTLSLTNSVWIGNQGQQWKWGIPTNASFLAQNNLIVGNCNRDSQQLPGASQTFNSASGLNGAYLGDFCRAAGGMVDLSADANSAVNFVNNTIVTYSPTIFTLACTTGNNCTTTPFNFTNNIFLGYSPGYSQAPFQPGVQPGLYFPEDSSVVPVGSHNIDYGVRNADTCGSSGNICVDPLFVSEPAQGAVAPTEAALDVFNPATGMISGSSSFMLTASSPAIGAGISNSFVPSLDYNNHAQTSPPVIGAYIYFAGGLPPLVYSGLLSITGNVP